MSLMKLGLAVLQHVVQHTTTSASKQEPMVEGGSDVLAWGAVEGICAVFVLTIVWRGLVKQYKDRTAPSEKMRKQK